MDLQLFFRVMWRFRVLVAGGLLLASILALVSYVRVSVADGKPTLTYRESETWASYARLRLEWRAGAASVDDASDPIAALQASDQRLAELAVLYARLIDSDAVHRIVLRDGPFLGQMTAVPLPATEGSDATLPIIELAGLSDSPQRSLVVTERAAAALAEYIQEDQRARGVKPSDGLVASEIKHAGNTELFVPRSRTRPIVIFLTVLIAALGLAFILENVRPRSRPIPVSDSPARRHSAVG